MRGFREHMTAKGVRSRPYERRRLSRRGQRSPGGSSGGTTISLPRLGRQRVAHVRLAREDTSNADPLADDRDEVVNFR